MEHDLNILMIFGIKRKIYNFDSYNVFLAIAINEKSSSNIDAVTQHCFCAPGSHF